MGGRCTERGHEFRADVDAVLRVGKGLMEMEARREAKNYQRRWWVGRYG